MILKQEKLYLDHNKIQIQLFFFFYLSSFIIKNGVLDPELGFINFNLMQPLVKVILRRSSSN